MFDHLTRNSSTSQFEISAVKVASNSFNDCLLTSDDFKMENDQESDIYRQWLISCLIPKIATERGFTSYPYRVFRLIGNLSNRKLPPKIG